MTLSKLPKGYNQGDIVRYSSLKFTVESYTIQYGVLQFKLVHMNKKGYSTDFSINQRVEIPDCIRTLKRSPQNRKFKLKDSVMCIKKGKVFGKECKIMGYAKKNRQYMLAFIVNGKVYYDNANYKQLIKKKRHVKN